MTPLYKSSAPRHIRHIAERFRQSFKFRCTAKRQVPLASHSTTLEITQLP